MHKVFKFFIEQGEDHVEWPLIHRMGKLLAATVAAFVATVVAEKAYEAVYEAKFNKDLQLPSSID